MYNNNIANKELGNKDGIILQFEEHGYKSTVTFGYTNKNGKYISQSIGIIAHIIASI